MEQKKDKDKLPDAYDQGMDLDGGMSSWTYGLGPVTSEGMRDDLSVTFDVNDNLYQSSFDFEDEKLRIKYPALQDAWNHYQSIKQMCETREKEENDS